MHRLILTFIASTIFITPAHAGIAIHCDSSGHVTGINERAGLKDYQIPHTIVWSDPCPDGMKCMTKSDLATIVAEDMKYMVCEDSDADLEMDTISIMSQSEKDSLDAEAALQHTSGMRTVAAEAVDADTMDGRVLRALALVMLDEINLIRSNLIPAQSPRSMSQLKSAIKNKISSGDAD